MASNNYIPARDSLFSPWFTGFQNYATTHATALGLTTVQTDALLTALTNFDTAYDAHLVVQQTAKVKTEAKKAARKSAETTIREIVNILQANPAVTDEQRLALGIPVRKSGRTPVPPPSTKPVAEIEVIEEFSHTLRLFDSASNRSARPDGVEAAEVHIKIVPAGGPPPADPAEFSYAGLATTTKVKREFDAADAGKTCYYRMRWVNNKGETGDWGPQVSATIAA